MPQTLHRTAPTITGLLAGVLAATPLLAQEGSGPARDAVPDESQRPPVSLSLLSGGAAFSAFRGQQVQATLLEGGATRSFERLIAPETATALSLAASWWPSAAWGLRLGVGWSPSSIGIRLEERDRAFLQQGGAVGESARWADLSVWSAEAAVLVGLPTIAARLEPYLIAGAGVVLYDVDRQYADPVPLGVRQVLSRHQRSAQPALVLGAGIWVPLRPSSLRLTFELLDHLTLSPFDQREHAVVERERVRLELDAPEWPPSERRVINHLRFSLGLAFPLGR